MNLDSSDDGHTIVANDATASTSTSDDTVVEVGVSGRSLTMCKGRGKNKKNARNPNEGALGSDGTAGAGADTPWPTPPDLIERRVGRGSQAHREAMAECFRRFEREV